MYIKIILNSEIHMFKEIKQNLSLKSVESYARKAFSRNQVPEQIQFKYLNQQGKAMTLQNEKSFAEFIELAENEITPKLFIVEDQQQQKKIGLKQNYEVSKSELKSLAKQCEKVLLTNKVAWDYQIINGVRGYYYELNDNKSELQLQDQDLSNQNLKRKNSQKEQESVCDSDDDLFEDFNFEDCQMGRKQLAQRIY